LLVNLITCIDTKIKCIFTGPPNISLIITTDDVRWNGFTISWTVPSGYTGNMTVCGSVMYNVTVNGMSDVTSMNNITYSGLRPSTSYFVIVTPYNNAGAGTPTNITVTTLIPPG